MKSNFQAILDKQKRNLAAINIGQVAGNAARQFFITNFQRQGSNEDGFKKWATPQRQIPGTAAYKQALKISKRTSRQTGKKVTGVDKPILVKTGLLRDIIKDIRSLRIRKVGGKYIIQISVKSSEVPYAAAMNYGVASKNIPARPFLYDSRYLRNRINSTMRKEINIALNK